MSGKHDSAGFQRHCLLGGIVLLGNGHITEEKRQSGLPRPPPAGIRAQTPHPGAPRRDSERQELCPGGRRAAGLQPGSLVVLTRLFREQGGVGGDSDGLGAECQHIESGGTGPPHPARTEHVRKSGSPFKPPNYLEWSRFIQIALDCQEREVQFLI